MHAIQHLARAASFSGPLSPSNTVLGKRRALADEPDVDEQPDVKRAKGSTVLDDEYDARANKENVPPFARGTLRRPPTLSRRASTGPGPGAAAPSRLRRSVSYASTATPPKKDSARPDWVCSPETESASSVSSSP